MASMPMKYLFQLADDVSELRAVTRSINWLEDHGYLDIEVRQASRHGSILIGKLTILWAN
jgi:hypothetical protein